MSRFLARKILKKPNSQKNGDNASLFFRSIALCFVLVLCFSSSASASPYQPRKAPGPLHGDDPHGDDPHGDDPHVAPPHDPGLPANHADRDPYDGKEGNDRSHPSKPY